MNAIYFKGNWFNKFDPELTKVEPFYLGSNKNQVVVDMMHIKAKYRHGSIEDLDSRVLELPYVVIIYS